MTANPNSILDSVKKAVGLGSDDTSFDLDLTMFINSAFVSLRQIGVGPDSGFSIEDNSAVWSDLTCYFLLQRLVPVYVFLKAQLLFDPPSTGFVLQAKQALLAEAESRLIYAAEEFNPPEQPPLHNRWRSRCIAFVPKWWDLTSGADFPEQAVPGDYGIDTSTGNFYVYDKVIARGYFWDLTGLSDFPTEAAVGDLGIDQSSGAYYQKTS